MGSVFHEDDGGDAVAFGGEAVDLAHFGGCQDFLHQDDCTTGGSYAINRAL